MVTTADAKLPAIEHIKARKDGLDVLADIYRYAELGFDAIEPDDLALFRWYGIYTQRAEQSAASGDPGPSEDTDGYFMLRIKFPNGVVTADQLRAVGRLTGAAWATSRPVRTSSSIVCASRTCRSSSTS